jgi:hypothetical protein
MNDEPRHISLTGSTLKVFDLKADAAGVYRLRVRSEGRPKLQVTVIRLPDDSPEISAAAEWLRPESPSAEQSPSLDVRIPSPLKIVRASVECRRGSHHQSVCFEGEQFQIEKHKNQGEPLQAFMLNLPERLLPREQSSPDAVWRIKILAEDENGRKAACWIDLPPPPAEPQKKPVPVAGEVPRKVF